MKSTLQYYTCLTKDQLAEAGPELANPIKLGVYGIFPDTWWIRERPQYNEHGIQKKLVLVEHHE